MLPSLTAEATVVADPEMRFSPSGQAWTRVRLVCNDRVKDAQGQWTDGEPMFFSAVIFGKPAEHLAESVLKGDRLVVSGRVKFNEWETQEGEKRKDLEVIADTVAVGLLFGAAKTDRMRGEHQPGPGRAAPQTGVSPDPFASNPFGSAPQPAEPPF
jgi:single-strand DNA-binding protein